MRVIEVGLQSFGETGITDADFAVICLSCRRGNCFWEEEQVAFGKTTCSF